MFSRGGDDGGPPPEAAAWHRDSADDAAGEGHWFAVAWHLDRLVGSGEDGPAVRARRAAAYAGLGRFEEAVADYEKALKAGPGRPEDWAGLGEAQARLGRKGPAARSFARATEAGSADPAVWYKRAVLLADAADGEAYRRVCGDMLRRFDKAAAPEVVYLTALACSARAGAADDFGGALDRMSRVATKAPTARNLGGLGLLLYRAGKDEEAVAVLGRAMAAQGNGGDPWNWLVLSLAHARLGHRGEAGRWLRRSAAWLDGPAARNLAWADRMYLQLLRQEAARALGGEVPAEGDQRDSV
jgi:tetratricopeptide (TPR) repeat protein